MKKAIVSGANGFIGNAVVKELVANNYQVYALHSPRNKSNVYVHEHVIPISFDLADAARLHQSIPVDSYDAFYHFAWAGTAGQSRTDIDLQLNNIKWTADTLHIAKKIGCRRFIGAGSIMEYEALEVTYNQYIKPGLTNIYSISKTAAHTICMAIAGDIGIDAIWAVITNTYGVGERSERLINSTIRKCLKGEIPQFTKATQYYDFVYIDDLARAFRLIGEKGKPFHEYLIGSGNARPLKEYLIELNKIVAPKIKFEFGGVPFAGIHVPREKFNTLLTQEHTGFYAHTDFKEGCKLTLDWIKHSENIST